MNARHPCEAELALLAGGDCGLFARLRLNRHVARCGDCRDTVASFGEWRSEVNEFAGNYAVQGLDWDHLAGEMRANIRLGLDAGECVREAPAAVRNWYSKPQFAIGMAGVLLLAGAGVFLNNLLPHTGFSGGDSSVVHAASLESTGTGVAVRTDAGSMTLLNHGDVAGSQTVTAQGAIRASYVDGNTGTVTITSVSLE